MHKTVIVLMAALALAGCTADKTSGPAPAHDADALITLAGIVQDRDVVPVAGAVVTVRESNLTFTTGPDGMFAFTDLEDGFYILDATAPDHDSATLTYRPGDAPELLFVLTRLTVDPFSATEAFHGIIECAAEYVIITPSCDTITEYAAQQGVPLPGGGDVVGDVAEFDIQVDPGWQTLVVDVTFDLSSQPGLEAMRTVFSAVSDPNELTSYEQYGRFQDATSYTFRIEPGQTYADGVAPVDGGLTSFRINVYGQGHGWHEACDPVTDTCTLGVGAGIDVSFDVYVTAFYVDPAPEGWSFQA